MSCRKYYHRRAEFGRNLTKLSKVPFCDRVRNLCPACDVVPGRVGKPEGCPGIILDTLDLARYVHRFQVAWSAKLILNLDPEPMARELDFSEVLVIARPLGRSIGTDIEHDLKLGLVSFQDRNDTRSSSP